MLAVRIRIANKTLRAEITISPPDQTGIIVFEIQDLRTADSIGNRARFRVDSYGGLRAETARLRVKHNYCHLNLSNPGKSDELHVMSCSVRNNRTERCV